MADVMTNLKDDILQCLAQAAGGADDPTPPSSYYMSSVESMAMSIFDNNPALRTWMHGRGLDPLKGPQAVLGLGCLLVRDAEINPRFELTDAERAELADDHDH